jgi:hypothetical protein
MAAKRRDKELEEDLTALLSARFPGISVSTAYSDRWGRMSVTFRWAGFSGLLPEERFHRLAAVIPAAFRETRLAGFVWLELAPKESIDSFLKLPRSEDIARRARRIHGKLAEIGFFEGLRKRLGASPKKKCGGDFSLAAETLSSKKASASLARDARLLFIRHGAYCDCQVMESVEAAGAGG